MGFTETFNARVLPAAQRAFGVPALFRHGLDEIDVTLFVNRRLNPSRDALGPDFAATRLKAFVLPAASLAIDEELFIPAAGDELRWTDPQGDEQVWSVFPAVNEQCSSSLDTAESQLIVYAVAAADLQSVVVHLKDDSEPRTVNAVLSIIRGAEDFTIDRSETRVLTATACVAASSLADVSVPPAAATCDALGHTGWSIDLTRTEWGLGLLKIGLVRETLVREWQARRNATV